MRLSSLEKKPSIAITDLAVEFASQEKNMDLKSVITPDVWISMRGDLDEMYVSANPLRFFSRWFEASLMSQATGYELPQITRQEKVREQSRALVHAMVNESGYDVADAISVMAYLRQFYGPGMGSSIDIGPLTDLIGEARGLVYACFNSQLVTPSMAQTVGHFFIAFPDLRKEYVIDPEFINRIKVSCSGYDFPANILQRAGARLVLPSASLVSKTELSSAIEHVKKSHSIEWGTFLARVTSMVILLADELEFTHQGLQLVFEPRKNKQESELLPPPLRRTF